MAVLTKNRFFFFLAMPHSFLSFSSNQAIPSESGKSTSKLREKRDNVCHHVEVQHEAHKHHQAPPTDMNWALRFFRKVIFSMKNDISKNGMAKPRT